MIGITGALLLQHQILRNSNYGSYSAHQTETKKQYYKLLKLKPMFIKLNVSSHGSQFLPQIINASMIKEIRGGYMDLNGLSPDKWCVIRYIDGDELYAEGNIDDLQSKIWNEQDKTLDVRIRNGRSGLGPL